MYKSIFKISAVALFVLASAFTNATHKLTSQKTHVKFFSHTSIEDISAENFKAVSTLDKASGDLVFSVPMQSFKFDKSLMQKHFNSDKFLNTQKFPKAKLIAKITNNKDVNYTVDGTYSATVQGTLELHGVTKDVTETGNVVVKGNIITVKSDFKIVLADYGIAFEKGKPSTNIAKTVDVSVESEYQ